MHADGYPVDAATDALVMNVAAKQFPDGSWKPWGFRPPMEFSAISATALSLRMLQFYGPPARHAEFAKRIQAARAYLRGANARTSEEKAMRLLGLKWAGARDSEVTAAADQVIAGQRADGGWGQLATLGPDAYATGQRLYALRVAGGIGASDSVYRRGAEYLRSTQIEDGSWRVTTRSLPVQRYKESGFPHGKDQWISAAGTSWAAMALMLGQSGG